MRILHGDCRDLLPTLPDASVDSIVTDPPYELGFMGKGWDAAGIAYDVGVWAECLRVLKPGGHLLAFGGSRTWHRLVVAIEDAGFEVRDSITWLYASGFPKSLDVSRAIDKARDDGDDVRRVTGEIRRLRDLAGLTNRDLDDLFDFAGMAGHWTSTKAQPAVPTVEQWGRLRDVLSPDAWVDVEVWRLNGRKGKPGNDRPDRVVAKRGENRVFQPTKHVVDAGTPVLDAAQQWQGWGTALKPAHEPICVARKPLAGTVAATVLAHGTGALNIDECRVAGKSTRRSNRAEMGYHGGNLATAYETSSDLGRWPSNVVLTHAPGCGSDDAPGECVAGCPVAELDAQSGASRFFPAFRYQAKAPSKERPKVDGAAHPTVKPLALMRWLVRLVTPSGGTVLDPFLGSGTTAEAALLEGFDIIGCELTADYLPLISARLARIPLPAFLDMLALHAPRHPARVSGHE